MEKTYIYSYYMLLICTFNYLPWLLFKGDRGLPGDYALKSLPVSIHHLQGDITIVM
jgi:hypothetical protein